MGIVRPDKNRRMAIEEFRKMLLSCAAVRTQKPDDRFEDQRSLVGLEENDVAQENQVVCVTSGVSFLGLAIVNQLLVRGYSVRIIVDNQEDIEKLREMELSGEMRGIMSRVGVVMANFDEVESFLEAFEGCCCVYHTAAFIDPAGISGYSKSMAEIEVKATKHVIEACAITQSVRKCVLTSSLLACTWRDGSLDNLSPVINHDCWSDESLCKEKRLWYALGKLRAEKAAWRIAEERGLKLATICPGLITGHEFVRRNTTSTLAYLKGAQEMYASGLLATVDVNRLAEAHVSVMKAMNKTAFGRYICFDKVIESEDEVATLEQDIGMQINTTPGNDSHNLQTRFKLSNLKLYRLMSRTSRCKKES